MGERLCGQFAPTFEASRLGCSSIYGEIVERLPGEPGGDVDDAVDALVVGTELDGDSEGVRRIEAQRLLECVKSLLHLAVAEQAADAVAQRAADDNAWERRFADRARVDPGRVLPEFYLDEADDDLDYGQERAATPRLAASASDYGTTLSVDCTTVACGLLQAACG
ncbi:hypothetical protein R8Z50_21910 [Longispora sp. K20-0274]|uniref:hypothetical protein n=1 Tax=Longispora sp. K20-0274 TaxID=3088255 RepID=UPI00399B64B3